MSLELLVSVVIPTYKRAAIVPNAIRSVLNQTHSNIEVLVVDDCSPDDTTSVVQGITDGRVKYLRHETNRGVSAARNTGINAAEGEYIAFLDDDDEWKPNKLKKQLAALKECDAVLCMGVSNGFPMQVHNRQSITLDDLRKGTFNPSSLVAKAHILKELLFDENLRQGEDWDVFIRIAQRYTVGWVSEPLLLYNEESPHRATDEKKALSGPDLEKRNAMLYKHREFFGEKWFNYHLADASLAYIGSGQNKFQRIKYTVKSCGFRAVAAALSHRVHRRIRHFMWTRA